MLACDANLTASMSASRAQLLHVQVLKCSLCVLLSTSYKPCVSVLLLCVFQEHDLPVMVKAVNAVEVMEGGTAGIAGGAGAAGVTTASGATAGLRERDVVVRPF